MAGLRLIYPINTVATANSSSAYQCIAFVKMPANQRGKLLRVVAGQVGADGSDPQMTYALALLSDDGTGGQAITPTKPNGDAETVQSSGKAGSDAAGSNLFSVQPTVSALLEPTPVYPQYTFQWVPRAPWPDGLPIPGGARLALLVNRNGSATTPVKIHGTIEIEE